MARYLGPKCRLSRREAFDLQLKSGLKPYEAKCRSAVAPGQHGAKKARASDYAQQLREKQKVKRMYGILEVQLSNYFAKASKAKGATGEVMLSKLESRLDNVVYRLGFAVTRADARQLVSHKLVMVNNRKINIPSYELSPGDVIELTDKAKAMQRVQFGIELSASKPQPEWLSVDKTNKSGVFKSVPQRDWLSDSVNEKLIVELYSK